MPDIRIYPSQTEFCAAAADLIISEARQAISQRDRFSIALSGGSTPKKVFELLAQPDRRDQIIWQKAHVFVGDDRFVPYDHPDSNYGMACKALLDHVPVPPENRYPIPTDSASPVQAAEKYAQTLKSFFGPDLPVLDINLLGLGDDGHTASLFPGKPTIHVTDRWVVDSPPGTLPPPVDRVTLTFPVLNAARAILMMVCGEKKAEAVADVLEHRPSADKRPAVLVSDRAIWMLDRPAASRLTLSAG